MFVPRAQTAQSSVCVWYSGTIMCAFTARSRCENRAFIGKLRIQYALRPCTARWRRRCRPASVCCPWGGCPPPSRRGMDHNILLYYQRSKMFLVRTEILLHAFMISLMYHRIPFFSSRLTLRESPFEFILMTEIYRRLHLSAPCQKNLQQNLLAYVQSRLYIAASKMLSRYLQGRHVLLTLRHSLYLCTLILVHSDRTPLNK